MHNTRHDFGAGEQVRGSDVPRSQGVQPADGLLGSALASAFAFVFGIERMQAARERRHAAKAEQDLVEQVRAALGEGNSEQDRPAVFRRRQGREAGALGQFFGLVDEAAEGGFEGHKVYLTTEFPDL